MSERLARWVPALLWAAAVFWLSSRSRLIEMPYVFGWDKLQHCVAYAAGGAAFAHAVGGRGRGPWTAVALGVLYGASDEIHQFFVPGRSSDVRDWLADALGVLAGVFIYRTFLSWREGRVAAGAAAVRS